MLIAGIRASAICVRRSWVTTLGMPRRLAAVKPSRKQLALTCPDRLSCLETQAYRRNRLAMLPLGHTAVRLPVSDVSSLGLPAHEKGARYPFGMPSQIAPHSLALILLFVLSCLSLPATTTEQAQQQVNTKIIRPGINAVAGVLPVGMCLFSDGFSRENDAQGQRVQGVTGFYSCTVYRRIAIQVIPLHWLDNTTTRGSGDISIGPKILLTREKNIFPTLSTAYTLKVPVAKPSVSSGYLDHKLTVYADKRVGRGRVSLNYAVRWVGTNRGFARFHTRSVGVLHPVRGRFGVALQTYNTSSPSSQTYGVVSAGTYHVRPHCSIHFGIKKSIGRTGRDMGLVWGITTTAHLWGSGR